MRHIVKEKKGTIVLPETYTVECLIWGKQIQGVSLSQNSLEFCKAIFKFIKLVWRIC